MFTKSNDVLQAMLQNQLQNIGIWGGGGGVNSFPLGYGMCQFFLGYFLGWKINCWVYFAACNTF